MTKIELTDEQVAMLKHALVDLRSHLVQRVANISTPGARRTGLEEEVDAVNQLEQHVHNAWINQKKAS